MKTIAGLVVASLTALTVWQVVNNPSEAVTAAAPAAAAAPAVVAQAPAPAAPASSAATPSAPAPAEAPATGEAPVQDAPLRVAQALFREGTHYQRLPSAQPTSSPPGTIEVTEFFMYTCPHCFNFEPHLSSWLKNKPSNVNFVRVPASFNPVAELHSKAFYAAEMLGVLDDVHEDFFREFHVKRNRMSSEGAVVKFFVDHGVDKQEFIDAMGSFPVDAKLKKASAMAQRYRLNSVPSVFVNGKYRTDATMAGDYPRLLQVIDFLVTMETSAASASATGN